MFRPKWLEKCVSPKIVGSRPRAGGSDLPLRFPFQEIESPTLKQDELGQASAGSRKSRSLGY